MMKIRKHWKQAGQIVDNLYKSLGDTLQYDYFNDFDEGGPCLIYHYDGYPNIDFNFLKYKTSPYYGRAMLLSDGNEEEIKGSVLPQC